METGSGLSRREVLIRLSGAIAAATMAVRRGLPAGSGIKRPSPGISAVGAENAHFFTSQEREVIATVADHIIPTDTVSAGARAAGVHEWIDFVVANSPLPIQQQWRLGLAALDRASEQVAGHRFLGLEYEQQRKLLEHFAEREDAPMTPGERFFVLAKEATVNGYYTSEIGLVKDLQYGGGAYVSEADTACPARAEPHSKRDTQ